MRRFASERLSTYQIAFRLATSQTNVRYWLRKFGIKTSSQRAHQPTCSLCGKPHNPCRDKYRAKCWACYVAIRRLRIRIAAFHYKGGKCERCNRSDGPLGAYDFHHVGSDKEFTFARAHSYSRAKIRRELDKCVLLCAFCHRVEHAVSRPEIHAEAVRAGYII